MLTIRSEQFRAFAEARVSAFKAMLLADLRQRLAAEGRVLDDGELRHEVEQGIAAAQAAGFDRECDVAQYVLTVATHFGGRWSQPLPEPARIILGADGISGERRLAMLDEWARDMKAVGF